MPREAHKCTLQWNRIQSNNHFSILPILLQIYRSSLHTEPLTIKLAIGDRVRQHIYPLNILIALNNAYNTRMYKEYIYIYTAYIYPSFQLLHVYKSIWFACIRVAVCKLNLNNQSFFISTIFRIFLFFSPK